MKNLDYGDKFIYDANTAKADEKEFNIEAYKALIFIKSDESTFMYASKAGQHTRPLEALNYCRPVSG